MSELLLQNYELSAPRSTSSKIEPDILSVELPEKLQKVLTSKEIVLAAATQHWSHALFYPAVVVLTDRRLLICKPGMFGRMDFTDYAWREGMKVHAQAGMLTTMLTVSANCREVDGKCQAITAQVYGLEKELALRLYTKAQQLEEQWREILRAEELKRMLAQSGAATIYANPMTPFNPLSSRLDALKALVDQGVIGQAQFDTIKAEVISRA